MQLVSVIRAWGRRWMRLLTHVGAVFTLSVALSSSCTFDGSANGNVDAAPESIDSSATVDASLLRACEMSGAEYQEGLESGILLRVFVGNVNFDEAQALCEADEAQLAILDTEMKLVDAGFLGGANRWIGLVDPAQNNEWEWQTGEPVPVGAAPWLPNKPDNPTQHCGALRSGPGPTIGFDDEPCETGSFPALCECAPQPSTRQQP